MKIGIDIGGVIIDRERNDNTDTSLFGPNYLNALAVPDAIEAISVINKDLFPNETYIISKCGANIERKSREWLKHNQFYEKTRIPEDHVYFCRERHDKAPIAKQLGLTHFIDDKVEVLGYMQDVVPNRLLFNPSTNEMMRAGPLCGPVFPVFLWQDAILLLERMV